MHEFARQDFYGFRVSVIVIAAPKKPEQIVDGYEVEGPVAMAVNLAVTVRGDLAAASRVLS